MSKHLNPHKVMEELCNGGIPKGEVGVIMARSDGPKTHLQTIQLDKDTINDIMHSIIFYIEGINKKNNKDFYEPQKERLISFLKVLNGMEKKTMKTDLEKLLEYCIDRQKSLDSPASYQETEYYDACRAKSQMLDEIISEIKSIIQGDTE